MKVVYLDIDEEITAVIDKIKKTKVYDLALVVPKRSVLTQSIVNLKLLRKQIESIGKNVVVVVAEKNAYNLAKRAGLDVRSDIPVGGLDSGDSIEELQEEIAINARSDIRPQRKAAVEIKDSDDLEIHSYLEEDDVDFSASPKKRKKRDRKGLVAATRSDATRADEEFKDSVSEKLNKPVFIPRLGMKVFFGFLTVSFIVAGLIFFVLLPRADISIIPETETYISSVDVVIESNREEFDVQNNALPGELIFFEDDTESKTYDATTDKDVSTKARGQVTVFNSFSSSAQPLVASTRFQSGDGRVYRLVGDASIPGASIESGQAIPGQGTVTVEAEDPGSEFNIESGGLIIPGLTPAKQKDIYGEILKPIVGGEEKTLRVVGQEDIDRATQELSSPVYDALLEKLSTKVSSDLYFFPGAVKKEIVEHTLSTEANSEVENFDISARVRVSTLVFSKKDIEKIIEKDVASAVSSEKRIQNIGIDQGVSAELQNFDFEEKKMGIALRIEKKLYYVLDENFIRQEIKGSSEEEIESFLREFPHIDSYTVNLWPFWVSSAPKIDKKVQIILDNS